MKKRILGLVALAALTLAGAGYGANTVEELFRKADKSNFRISPDGSRVSWLQPVEGSDGKRWLNIMVAPSDDLSKAVTVTQKNGQDVHSYGWANGDTLVFEAADGDKVDRVFTVGIDGTGEYNLSERAGYNDWAYLYDSLPNDPEHVLLEVERHDDAKDRYVYDIVKMNVNTGEVVDRVYNPGTFEYWGQVDRKGDVRTSVGYDGSDTIIYYRDKDNQFKELVKYDFHDEVRVVGVTADNSKLYVMSNQDSDKMNLYEFDPLTKSKKLLFKNDDYDLKNISVNNTDGSLASVNWVGEQWEEKAVNPGRQATLDKLKTLIPDREVMIIDRSGDDSKMLVKAWDDRDPGTYYFYDKAHPDSVKLLEKQQPWLDRDGLATMQAVTYTARDGLEIPGYLMVPPGKDPKNLPMVVYIHGGPESREERVYVNEFQAFTNRGYGVFIPNFRGSTGYGKKFRELGFKQWGEAMLNDVTDGTKWLIDQGIADPKQVAVFGVSYGGQAALMSLAKESNLYYAGVDWVGVTDLVKMLEEMPESWRLAQDKIYATKGDPDKDRDYLIRNSPINNVDRITKPVFVAYGEKDYQVLPDHTRAFIKKMKDAGRDVEVLHKTDEGHNFEREENLTEMFTKVLAFLDRRIPAPSPIKPKEPTKVTVSDGDRHKDLVLDENGRVAVDGQPKDPLVTESDLEKKTADLQVEDSRGQVTGKAELKLGKKVVLKAGKNVILTAREEKDRAEIGVALSPTPSFDAVTSKLTVTKLLVADRAATDDLRTNKLAIGIKGPRMTEKGIDMNKTSLVNLKASDDPTSAATVGYVNRLMRNGGPDVAPVVDRVNTQLARQSAQMGRLGAMTAAMSAMQSMDYSPEHPTTWTAGYGFYRGTGAWALGLTHYFTPDLMVNAGASFVKGDSALRLGASWRTGKGPSPSARGVGADSLELQRAKEQIAELKEQQAKDRQVIEEQNQRLERLEKLLIKP